MNKHNNLDINLRCISKFVIFKEFFLEFNILIPLKSNLNVFEFTFVN